MTDRTLETVYKKLIAKHPDCLLQVIIRFSPGLPDGRIAPFFTAYGLVDGNTLYYAPKEHGEFPYPSAGKALKRLSQLI